jgi:hypothetical protein
LANDCLIPRQDIAETAEFLKQEISTRVLNGAPVIPMSDEDILAHIFAGAAWETGGIAESIIRESNPATMCCDNLINYAARRGLHLQSANRAIGFVRLKGVAGSAIPPNIKFVQNGFEYELAVNYNNPIVIASNGEAIMQIQSVDGGAAYNIGVGVSLTLTSTVAGLDGSHLTTSEVTGGTDEEDCETLRARILSYEKRGGVVGNLAWLEAETLKMAGVTKVCFDTCGGCCDDNWVTIYPFMHGTYEPYGVPSAAALEQMTIAMFGNPVGSGKGIAPIGLGGVYLCARPQLFSVVINGLNINQDTANAIRASIEKDLLDNVCVGGNFCKKIVEQAIFKALPNACYTSIEFILCETCTQDNVNIFLECGTFPVLENLTFG